MAVWDGSWGHMETPIEEPPVAPPSTLKPTSYRDRAQSLGADFREVGPAATSSLNSVSSGTSRLSAVQRAAKLSQKVSKLALERPSGAWEQLREEFEVQKLVWQSVGMVKGKRWVERLSGPQTLVENALSERKTALAQEAVDRGDPSGDFYSNALKKAMLEVVQEEKSSGDRERLAERLRLASIPASLPREDTDKKELEALVVACHLGDDRLERLVRKTLLLPVPIELGAPVKKKSSSVGSVFAARATNGSLGTPVTVAALSTSLGMSTGGNRVSSLSTSGVGAAVTTKSASAPYVSFATGECSEAAQAQGDTGLLGVGAPVGAAKRASDKPRSRRVPSTPQIQVVDTMRFST